MTIPVPIIASLIAGAAAIFIAVVGALVNINSRLGKLEKGQEMLAAEIRASRERSDLQQETLATEIRASRERFDLQQDTLATEIRASRERFDLLLAAAEERAIARHNELLAEIRLWGTHSHDSDGTIFFRVPE